MRRPTIILVVLLCVAAAVVGTAQAAPVWVRTAGLDFWNLGIDKDHLRGALSAEGDVDAKRADAERRTEMADHIAARLCDGRLSLPEALEATTALVATDPEWITMLRTHYEISNRTGASATDREVVTYYVLRKVESLLRTAELRGDTTRMASVSARLAQLEAEVRGGITE